MWSVWSEKVQVYLGIGLVLVQRPGAPLWTYEPPATLPLADVLRQVDQAMDRANGRPWRVHLHLSAALCPPVAFVVPEGIMQYAELLAVAKASAAQIWDVPSEHAAEIVCCLDARHEGLAAAMLTGTHRVIVQWASEHKGQLTSLIPLWTAATASKACKGHQTHGVALLEPGALTVVNQSPIGVMQAKSWPGKYDATEAMSRMAAVTDQADKAEHSKGVVMAFHREPTHAAWKQGPSVWLKHWSLLP